MSTVPAKVSEVSYADFDLYADRAQGLATLCVDVKRALKGVYSCCPSSQIETAHRVLKRI
jgi:hypothetical protein